MKKLKIYTLLTIAFIVFSSSAWVTITLMRPAPVALPSEIHSIAIIDRTLQEKTKNNTLEKTLSGEAFKQDEQALRELKVGIIERCNEYGELTFLKTEEQLISNFTKNTFPTLLSWEKVAELCKKHNSDALLSIELFDSDFLLTPTVVGGLNSPIKLSAGGIAVINVGIRIYYPATQTIIDEYKTEQRININTNTSTAIGVANTMLDKTDAINRTSYESGRTYGDRISPSFYTVTREFFDKPKKNQNLKAGVRKSEVADWKGAIESWTKALNDKKKKVRRRAAYNIAVGYEVLGDLQKAKEWASKAYTEYGEEEAKQYYDLLVQRINQEETLRRQGK